MTFSIYKEDEWDDRFKKLLSHLPSAKLGAEQTKLDIHLLKPLKLRVKQLFEQVFDEETLLLDNIGGSVLEQEYHALLEALQAVNSSPLLPLAFQGQKEAQIELIEDLITTYLTYLPWGQISEYDLAKLWLGWHETLSEESGLALEELWTNLPSVKLSQWQDIGFKTILEQTAEQVFLEAGQRDQDHSADSPLEKKSYGICLKGAGKSAHLAFARRFFLSLGQNSVAWLDHQDAVKAQIVLLDDLVLKGRESRWYSAAWCAQQSSSHRLIIWGDEHLEKGLGEQLKASLTSVIDLDLDRAWEVYWSIQSSERQFDSLPNWLSILDQNLTLQDQLRCMTLMDKVPSNPPKIMVSDLEAYAALIGPLASLSVLKEATKTSEDVLKELLKGGGWLEVDDCEVGGRLFAPPTIQTWYVALVEGGKRSHSCAHLLQEALEKVYPPRERLKQRSALQRLSRLRGRQHYLGQSDSGYSFEQAQFILEQLRDRLVDKKVSVLTLSTLCGLGFDFANKGPLVGQWQESIHALQISIAAAEKLRDPQTAGRLLRFLGKLALDDGQLQLAEESLEVALQLLQATRRGEEACNAAYLFSEVALLKGKVNLALDRLLQAEKVAQNLMLPREAWRCRFRAGQIYAQAQFDQQALIMWQSLDPQIQQEAAQQLKHPLNGPLASLYLEMASSELYLGLYEQAYERLLLIEDQRLEQHKQTLLALCAWFKTHSDPSELWTKVLVYTQQTRDIGSWLALQDWRALVSLELHQTKSKSGSPFLSLTESRLGLELAVKVFTGARDRLSLKRIYERLSEIYSALGESDAAAAALAMSKAWTVEIEFRLGSGFGEGQDNTKQLNTNDKLGTFRAQERIKDLETKLASSLTATLLQQAKKEVKKVTQTWLTLSLSAEIVDDKTP